MASEYLGWRLSHRSRALATVWAVALAFLVAAGAVAAVLFLPVTDRSAPSLLEFGLGLVAAVALMGFPVWAVAAWNATYLVVAAPTVRAAVRVTLLAWACLGVVAVLLVGLFGIYYVVFLTGPYIALVVSSVIWVATVWRAARRERSRHGRAEDQRAKAPRGSL